MRPDFPNVVTESMEVFRSAAEDGDPYDVIIIESELPGLDCCEFSRTLKKDPDLKLTPIILIAPSFDVLEDRAIQSAGFSGCLVRPLRHLQLIEVLNAIEEARESGNLDKTIPGYSFQGPVTTRKSDQDEVGLYLEKRLLVAEDNLVNQMVAKNILESFGSEVEIISNGRDAIEKFMDHSFDLIFMECQMPEMDGY